MQAATIVEQRLDEERQCAVAQLGVTLGANERYELRGSVRLGEGVRDMGDEVREQLERERTMDLTAGVSELTVSDRS